MIIVASRILSKIGTTEEAMDCSGQGQGGQDTCTADEDNSESSLLHQKRPDRPTPDSSPSKTTQSPQHKKSMRRSRSFTECGESQPLQAHTSQRVTFPARPQSLTHLSLNHYTPLKSNHSLEEFHLNESESKSFQQLKETTFLFVMLK